MREWLAAPAGARNPELWRGLSVVAGTCFCLLMAAYLGCLHWQAGWLRETNGYVLGRDFLNFWMAGRAAWQADPGRFYDPLVYTELLQHMLGGRYMQQWSYPPMVLLLAAPFGLLPYLAAYAVWTGLGIVALWRALRLYESNTAFRLSAMAAAAMLLCLLCGQNALLTASALLAVFHWRATRPLLTGLLLGLLCCKPQVALLLPVMLLAERNWRALAAASVTVLALMGLVWVFYGSMLLQQYWAVGMPAQSQVLREPAAVIAALMPTPFIQFWLLGIAYRPAMAMQAALGLAMALLTYRAFRRPGPAEVKLLLLAIAGVLATPYLLSYDLVTVSVACMVMAVRQPLTRSEAIALALCVFLPWVNMVAVLTAVPLTWMPLAVMLWTCWQRLAKRLGADVAAAKSLGPVD